MPTNLLDPQTEAEAAELEGLVSVDRNPAFMRMLDEMREAKAAAAAAATRRDNASRALKAWFAEHGHQGATVEGAVVARYSMVSTPRIDTRGLQAKHPRIYATFVKVTQSVRLTVD